MRWYVFTLLIGSVLGCPAFAVTDSQPIRVGLIIQETRQDHLTPNPWGIQQKHGFELALKGSKNVTWTVKDDFESALVARDKATEFVKEGVDLVAGLSFSDQAIAVKQQTQAAGIPYIAVFATSEKLFDKDESVFSMATPDDGQVARLVKYLSKLRTLPKSGVGLIVARNSEYGVDMERALKAALKKQRIVINQYPDILRGRPVPHDYFKAPVTNQVIAVLAYEIEGLSVVNALGSQNFDGIVLGGDTWSTQTMQVAANLGLLSKICLVNPVSYDANATTPVNRKFVSDYKRRFGDIPTDVAALAYDAGMLITKAAEKCAIATNRKLCLSREIAKTRFQGVSGDVRFSRSGRRIEPGMLLKSAACAARERQYGLR